MAEDEHLDILEKGVEEWNKWREEHPDIKPDFSGENLSGVDLSGANMYGANLSGTDLSGANLMEADLSSANLSGTKLVGTNLLGTKLLGANLKEADLSKAHLSEMNLSHANLTRANLTGAILSKANLSETDLSGANLSHAILSGANLSHTILSGANLSHAILSRAVLSCANLSGTILRRANLSKVILRFAKLSRVNLENADLIEADLSKTDLSRAIMLGANLSGANLSEADLSIANFAMANLSGARLSFAHLIYTNLDGALVDDSNIHEVVIHGLQGLPEPPTTLQDEYDDFSTKPPQTTTRILTGREAADFFVRPEKVEVVLDKALTNEELSGYRMFIAECEANKRWPKSIVYLEGYVEKDHTILGFQAPKAEYIIRNLPFLLQPFRNAAAIDWEKTLAGITEEQKDGLVTTALAKPEFRSRIAERLWQFEGFAKSRPEAIREAGKSFKVEVNPDAVAALPPGSNLVLHMNIIEQGGQHMGDNIVGGDNFGGAVGDHAEVMIYKSHMFTQRIENCGLDGETKEVLVRAIEAVGTLELEDYFKQAVAEAVNQLRTELERPQRDAGKVKKIWQSIKGVASPVATILQTAAAVKELII